MASLANEKAGEGRLRALRATSGRDVWHCSQGGYFICSGAGTLCHTRGDGRESVVCCGDCTEPGLRLGSVAAWCHPSRGPGWGPRSSGPRRCLPATVGQQALMVAAAPLDLAQVGAAIPRWSPARRHLPILKLPMRAPGEVTEARAAVSNTVGCPEWGPHF